jgi:hypothetical protein
VANSLDPFTRGVVFDSRLSEILQRFSDPVRSFLDITSIRTRGSVVVKVLDYKPESRGFEAPMR